MNTKQIFVIIANEFIYGGHIFAIGAVSVVSISSILSNVSVTADFLVVVYLMFYAIYLNDHSEDVKKDFLTNTRRVEHLKKNKRISVLIVIAVFVLEFLLSCFGSMHSLFLGSIIVILGLFYGRYFKRITKKIVAFKNFFVALVWSILTFFFFLYYSYPLTPEIVLFAIFIFLRIFIVQISLDIRDKEGDEKERLLTIPVFFGKKTEGILIGLNILAFLLLSYSIYFAIFPKFSILLFLIFPYSFYYTNQIKSTKDSKLIYFLAVIEPVILLILILFGYFLL
ncbi:MAG: UbiA family prenyltransferase [Patescibacteria group bacterium]|nr:UbiA family prenyltransferase [Patescibacteria group bacterium]